MATAIREVELSAPIAGFDDLGRCERCMLVFRWRGVVAGRAFAPVHDGRVTASAVEASASAALGADARRVWLEDFLQFDERGGNRSLPPAVSVAVCTRERPADLLRTLNALSSLQPAADEILVVDNAPVTASTRDVVARFPRVRYIVEPERGLNRARNRALCEAACDIVAFTDDDAAPEAGWASALALNFRDERVLCTTGLTLPLELETPAQELFEEHCSFVRGFSRRVFDGRIDHPLIVAGIGAGANMAVRRSAQGLVGGFDERLDAGTPAKSGGDHDFFTRVLSAGYRIAYEPQAVSWHRHRRSFEELVDVVQGYGTGVYAMWTGRLLTAGDLGVLRLAWRWFAWDHLPLLRSPARLLSRGGRDRLRRAELLGCMAGPAAWFSSRRRRVSLAR
jgi:GT2 family glycosyltransferase